VLCPEKDKADYCDCDGDCDENPSFCECDEAKKCCSKKMLRTVVEPLCAGHNIISRQCGSPWNGAQAYCCSGLACDGYKCIIPQTN